MAVALPVSCVANLASPVVEPGEVDVTAMRVCLDRARERANGAWPTGLSTQAVARMLTKFVPHVGKKAPTGKDLKKFCLNCTADDLRKKLHDAGLVNQTHVVAGLIHRDLLRRSNPSEVPAAAPVAAALPEISATGSKRKRGSGAPVASGVACSDAEAAKLWLGTCGHCGGELPECWRPVVDKRPACDGCYASDKTLGAKEVAIYCDAQARVISRAAPDGHPATLEAQIVEALRDWNQLREKLESDRHLVMGGRAQPSAI